MTDPSAPGPTGSVPEPAAPGPVPPARADDPTDEWFERRELELGAERNRVGGEAARRLGAARDLLARLLPWLARSRRRAAAPATVEMVRLLGRLSEVREVRRGLLGLGPAAHIRSRATPNFVKDNPDYARAVAEEEPDQAP